MNTKIILVTNIIIGTLLLISSIIQNNLITLSLVILLIIFNGLELDERLYVIRQYERNKNKPPH